VENSLINNTN